MLKKFTSFELIVSIVFQYYPKRVRTVRLHVRSSFVSTYEVRSSTYCTHPLKFQESVTSTFYAVLTFQFGDSITVESSGKYYDADAFQKSTSTYCNNNNNKQRNNQNTIVIINKVSRHHLYSNIQTPIQPQSQMINSRTCYLNT